MNIHILGIAGTFMGSLAIIAREMGHRVTGCDANVYPPMSDLLTRADIAWSEGYRVEDIPDDVDCVVIGNAMSRGNPVVEHVLDHRIPFESGPRWLGDHILRSRKVLAVAGTHGKTTTSAMLAWILDYAGLEPGFLIGGAPGNFAVSARLGAGEWFVIEADEYDTAFFDKRSKFVHYSPQVAILNNLEFDHADIFADLAAIEFQFHQLVRIVPGSGALIVNSDDEDLARVLGRGAWSPVIEFGSRGWKAERHGTHVVLSNPAGESATTAFPLTGDHNLANAAAAAAAAAEAGVPLATTSAALGQFVAPRRRQQLIADTGGVRVIDDFAHHPSAIAVTLDGLKKGLSPQRIIAVVEMRSNSMRRGAHRAGLKDCFGSADRLFALIASDPEWDMAASLPKGAQISTDFQRVFDTLCAEVQPGDLVVFMSNGGFSGLPHRFARWISENA